MYFLTLGSSSKKMRWTDVIASLLGGRRAALAKMVTEGLPEERTFEPRSQDKLCGARVQVEEGQMQTPSAGTRILYWRARRRTHVAEPLTAVEEGWVTSQVVGRTQIGQSRAKCWDAVVLTVFFNQYFTACSLFSFMACLLYLLL